MNKNHFIIKMIIANFKLIIKYFLINKINLLTFNHSIYYPNQIYRHHIA